MTYEERLQLFRTNVGFALPNDVERKLDELGFFNAPASMKYHLSYEGGLFEHSMNVAISLLDISCKLQLTWQRPISPFVIGIFHDLCKCDLYKKQPDGTYIYNVDADSRHGIKSLEIARKIMDITDEEAACIEHHMGAFTEKDKWKAYSSAVQKYENVLWTHSADMYSSQILESKSDDLR